VPESPFERSDGGVQVIDGLSHVGHQPACLVGEAYGQIGLGPVVEVALQGR